MADRDLHAYALRLLKSVSGVLFGRNTFELFGSFWPEVSDRSNFPQHLVDFARELQAKPKFVVSSRNVVTSWTNTFQLEEPALDEVRQRIAALPGTMVVFGSPTLASSLAAAGLLAELHVLVQLLMADADPRPFAHAGRASLRLLGADRFSSGAVLLDLSGYSRRSQTSP